VSPLLLALFLDLLTVDMDGISIGVDGEDKFPNLLLVGLLEGLEVVLADDVNHIALSVDVLESEGLGYIFESPANLSEDADQFDVFEGALEYGFFIVEL